MADDEVPKWSPEEEKLLRHEAFTAAVLRTRAQAKGEKRDSVLFRILESRLAGTLVTVLIGGLLVQWLLASYQEKAKQNAIDLAEYRQYISKQQEIVQGTYDLVGQVAFGGQLLLSLTQPKFQLINVPPRGRETLSKQRAGLIAKHNELVQEWQRRRYKTGALLSYYHYGRKDIAPAWLEVQNRLDELLECSNKVYTGYLESPKRAMPEAELCRDERQKLTTDLGKLGESLERARLYVWQQRELPSTKPAATED